MLVRAVRQIRNKIILVVLTLLVFVGQVTIASALSCDMDMPTGSSTMDHASHTMDHSDSQKMTVSSKDCCDLNGSCSMSGCLSLALPEVVLFATDPPTTEAVNNFRLLDIRSTLTSLYRPPILS